MIDDVLKYEIYDPETDISVLETSDRLDLFHIAGKQVDAGHTDFEVIEVYEDHETHENIIKYLKSHGVFRLEAVMPDIPNKEILHNLDEQEQLEVLKFIPDHMLIGELRRRFEEYRSYADAIRDVGDRLKLYV